MAEAAQKVMEKRLKILRESRTGKKGSITKRINQLYQYVAEKEGRRATELLLKYLHKVYEELEKVCCEISELSDEYDGLNDLEDIRFEIETCEATVTEYLEERKDDPPSTNSSRALSWVKKHAPQFGKGYDGELGGSDSGESNGVEIKDMEVPAGDDQQGNDRKGKLMYSDSRPATPRILPKIPLPQISLQNFDITQPAIEVPSSTLDNSIAKKMENLHIDDQTTVKLDINSTDVDGGKITEGVERNLDDQTPSETQADFEKGNPSAEVAQGEEGSGKSVRMLSAPTLTIPLSLSFTGDDDVRKRTTNVERRNGNNDLDIIGISEKNGDGKETCVNETNVDVVGLGDTRSRAQTDGDISHTFSLNFDFRNSRNSLVSDAVHRTPTFQHVPMTLENGRKLSFAGVENNGKNVGNIDGNVKNYGDIGEMVDTGGDTGGNLGNYGENVWVNGNGNLDGGKIVKSGYMENNGVEMLDNGTREEWQPSGGSSLNGDKISKFDFPFSFPGLQSNPRPNTSPNMFSGQEGIELVGKRCKPVHDDMVTNNQQCMKNLRQVESESNHVLEQNQMENLRQVESESNHVLEQNQMGNLRQVESVSNHVMAQNYQEKLREEERRHQELLQEECRLEEECRRQELLQEERQETEKQRRQELLQEERQETEKQRRQELLQEERWLEKKSCQQGNSGTNGKPPSRGAMPLGERLIQERRLQYEQELREEEIRREELLQAERRSAEVRAADEKQRLDQARRKNHELEIKLKLRKEAEESKRKDEREIEERLRLEQAKLKEAEESRKKAERKQWEESQRREAEARKQAEEFEARLQMERVKQQREAEDRKQAEELEARLRMERVKQLREAEDRKKAEELDARLRLEQEKLEKEAEERKKAEELDAQLRWEQLQQKKADEDRINAWRAQINGVDQRSSVVRDFRGVNSDDDDGIRCDDDRRSQDSQSQLSRSSSGSQSSQRSQGVCKNEVDSWIDELDENRKSSPLDLATGGVSPNALMASLMQQYLPKVEIPHFNGEALRWVEFVVKFRDVVHDQPFLNDKQRNQLLMQHLRGEAKRAVREFVNDPRGYPRALKTLKYHFGQRPTVAKAVLSKVTKGKQVANRDTKGLADLYYSICDCLVTLKQLNYDSDLNSSDTLDQAVQRLPSGLSLKWAERSIYIRKQHAEPNLHHLEQWLKDRVLAQKEVYPLQDAESKESNSRRRRTPADESHIGMNLDGDKCSMCKESHPFWKCRKYKVLKPNERMDLVREQKRCFNCFSEDHTVPTCASKNRCFQTDCGRKHHTTLHEYFAERAEQSKAKRKKKKLDAKKKDAHEEEDHLPEEEVDAALTGLNVTTTKSTEAAEDESTVTHVTLCASITSKSVFLLIVAVTVHVDGKSFDTYALLDYGSQSSLLRRQFFQKFGVAGKKKLVYESTINEKAQEPVTVEELSVVVSARDGSNPLEIKSVYVQPSNMFNMPSRPCMKNNGDMYRHLDGLSFDAVKADDITLLIGGNAPTAHLYSDSRVGGDDEPVALKTRFGWTLFGQTVGVYDNGRTHCSTFLSEEVLDQSLQCFWETEEHPSVFINRLDISPCDEGLHAAVGKFWTQEHCGILPQREIAMSREDEEALKRLDHETRLVEGRYEVPMLWARPDVSLPDNLPVSRKMFNTLLRKFRSNPDVHEKIRQVIHGYLAADPPYARVMGPEEAQRTSKRTWTLPTHPVSNPNKPGKIRLVNNAAAEYQGVSLNNSLLTGPDMLNRLVGVLMRFRCGEVAIAADIEAMFHQVRVSVEDADALRFLWKDDLSTNDPPQTLQMLVHIFGAKDSPTCANYALYRTALDNSQNFDAEAFYSVLKSFYVDDLLKSIDSVVAAIRLAKQLIDMLKCGGFRLCKFTSNRPEVLEALPESEVSPSATLQIDSEDKVERALGVSWEVTSDVFTFTTQFKETSLTKRGVLKTTSSLFDPMGFLTPFLLRAKVILQALWRRECGWDDQMDEELQLRWQKWLESTKKLSSVRIPRQYVSLQERRFVEAQLHVFSDASEDAFGAVAYVRYSFKDGSHECALVMSKSRLAPIKTISLPRLELDAARCGARLARMILHELDLPIQTVKYWSDSTLVLQYIKNTQQRMKSRVANRVTEILETSEPDDWEHIPGTMNPADLLTRGVSDPGKLMTNRWFTGPEFLEENEDKWPSLAVDHLDPEDAEVKKRPIFVGVSFIETEAINWERISSWTRLLRVAATVLRFIELLRNRKREEEEKRLDVVSLSVAELKEAESMVLKDVQRIAFSEEIQAIRSEKPVPNNSQLSGLCPFIDASGMMRVGGRLGRIQTVHPDTRHPILLPRQHQVTKALIEHLHRRNGHVGPEHVLSLAREKYWVLSGRVVINQIVSRCFFCRVRRAKRMFPYMADLPECRAAIDQPPFSHCGVDLFGPIFIKQGRKRLKRWAVLFTCLTVRCIHLEVVYTCETDSFISAVKRFTNRRGCPTDVYSDNGTNFRGATTELKEFITKLDKKQIEDFATDFQIQWHFNPPSAPHMGGAWERLVRSSKEVLYGLVKDRTLTDPQLTTFLTEVEHIINSRPLTHLSEKIDDLDALTPNHILLGRHRNWHSIADVSEVDITSRKKWKQVQALHASFWSRWVKEYLPTLTKRACWRQKQPNFKEGELVLLQDDSSKRGKWPLGRITKVMPGKDDVVRVVEVRTRNGTYTRPVTNLFKLEDNDQE